MKVLMGIHFSFHASDVTCLAKAGGIFFEKTALSSGGRLVGKPMRPHSR
jgi:hypothetical protein